MTKKNYYFHILVLNYFKITGTQTPLDKLPIGQLDNVLCSGNTTLKDKLRTGRPSNIDENFVNAILMQNPRQLTRDTAGRLNASQSTVFHCLKKSEKINNL